jgi:hypothetical protein
MSRFPGTIGLLRHPLAVRMREPFIRVAFGGAAWRRQEKLMAAEF